MSIFRDIGESLGNAVMENVGRAASQAQERTPLPADLLESDDAYLVVFDAPGAVHSDVQAQFRNGAVEVRVDRFRAFREEFEMRYPGRGLSLDGHQQLPDGAAVDPDSATAEITDNGTLTVRIPKTGDDRDDPDSQAKADTETAQANDEWVAGDEMTAESEQTSDGEQTSDS
jgi:HSP20 family protein